MLQKARLCAYAESLVGITLTVFFNKGQGEVKKTLIRATFLLLERRILTPGGEGGGRTAIYVPCTVAQKGHTCKLKMLLQIKNSTCKLKIVHAN